MAIQSSRHEALLEELREWWEDLRDRGTGSRVVLVSVPRRWGRSYGLEEFRKVVEDLDGPLAFPVSFTPLADRAVQAEDLRKALTTAKLGSRSAELLGLDTVPGDVQLGLGITGLFVSGLAMAVPLLLTSLAVTAAGNAWDASPSGQQGAVARAARAVATASVSAPVLVTVDDAELLDVGLAVTMIENLAGRYDGQVLVVATITPGSDLEAELLASGSYELLGRVHKADADPDMSYAARVALVREASPDVPDAAIERIGRRTQNFAEVFAVLAAGRLPDLAQEPGAAPLAATDAIINAAADRAKVSAEATILAWAGGALLVRQVERALEVLGADQQQGDPWVVRSGELARLTDPASPRLAEQVAGELAAHTRSRLAAVVLEEAVSIAADPSATLVERVIARQAAHHVRRDLNDRGQLTTVQCMLIRGLEKLADPEAAYRVATTALAELPPGDHQNDHDRREILKAVLRLARIHAGQDDDPIIEEAITLALSGGAILGLEARVWAAVDLLDKPGRREAALKLTDQVTTELARRPSTEETANQWRLMLAFHIGRAGHPAISHQLLAPIINRSASEQQEAAQKILRAIGGPRADTRLQIIIMEAELADRPRDAADDLLRLHSALAADYYTLGDYRRALQHGKDELALRIRLQGPDRQQTLETRAFIANWTGQSGDSAQALRMCKELLPDQARILGWDHPETLATRGNIAAWTGRSGDSAQALRLYQELLPDRARAMGWDHEDTLATRIGIAAWTGQCGDSAQALRLYQELLPDQARVMGPDHPDTLSTRSNIATWTGRCGDSAHALRLCEELLSDRDRVLGQDHPTTLTTRGNIAFWTGRCGDSAEALRMVKELLPDVVRVMGRDHPDTLSTRGNIAGWTGHSGESAEALLCTRSCSPIGRGSWAATIQTPWSPEATSHSGPASVGIRRRPCGYIRSCCPTRRGSWAGTTPTPRTPCRPSQDWLMKADT